MAKTTQQCIETLHTRIELAQKVMDLFTEQTKKNPSMSFMICGKEAIRAAAYLETFGSALNSLEEVSREDLLKFFRSRLHNQITNQSFMTLDQLASLRERASAAALAETIEILSDSEEA